MCTDVGSYIVLAGFVVMTKVLISVGWSRTGIAASALSDSMRIASARCASATAVSCVSCTEAIATPLRRVEMCEISKKANDEKE